MKFTPDKCIKCEKVISVLGAPKGFYNEAVFQLSNGSKFFVGICSDCNVETSEYADLLGALQEYQITIGVEAAINAFITAQVSRQDLKDVLISVQGGNCAKCGKPLGETFVQTNGKIQHESCNLPDKDKFALLAEIQSLKDQLNGV